MSSAVEEAGCDIRMGLNRVAGAIEFHNQIQVAKLIIEHGPDLAKSAMKAAKNVESD